MGGGRGGGRREEIRGLQHACIPRGGHCVHSMCGVCWPDWRLVGRIVSTLRVDRRQNYFDRDPSPFMIAYPTGTPHSLYPHFFKSP